jgi:hypothetical protein
MLRNILLAFLPYVFLQQLLKPSNVSVGSLSLELAKVSAINKEIQRFYVLIEQQ